ncbi:MAG TPA: RsiV family protein, partial [Pyrinomonadaceae bacterium]|nr:RsiV family protein [Pyrinomonadaceae bacterium]
LDDEGIRAGAEPKAENYENWTITPRGLVVTFDYYQLGSYAAGAQKIILPYAELKDVIKPDGPLAPFLK